MDMEIAMRAFFLLASLPNSCGTFLQRRAAAFSSLVCDRAPTKSPSSRQHHARQTFPRTFPMLDTHRHQCLVLPKHHGFSGEMSTASITNLFMASNDDEDSSEMNEERTSFNVPVLKKETTRLIMRAHKKVGKVSTRIRAVEDQYDKLRVAIDESEGEDDEKLLQQLEQAPNVAELQREMKELQNRLQKLNWLEEQFGKSPLKSKKEMSVEDIQKIPDGDQVVQYVRELEISDDANKKQKLIEQNAKNRRSKKERQATLKEQGSQQQGGRLPYRRYYTEQKVEIRVGKQATDNDVLSLSPEHRSGAHWWYHASGCAGSHVVLCTDAASPSDEDVLDAASLAALKSKCIGQSVIKVSMTRARNVSKPRGAKPGLVQLNGDVRTVTIRKSDVEKRCQRLEETVVVN